MAGLVLSLKPNEKFLVNGALLSNGPKRGQICVDGEGVNVLRMSDVIHPNEVNTPVRRVYYAAQLILSGDAGAVDLGPDVRNGIEGLAAVFEDTSLMKNIGKAQQAASSARYYSVLCALKPLMRVESELLARPVPTHSNYVIQPAMAS